VIARSITLTIAIVIVSACSNGDDGDGAAVSTTTVGVNAQCTSDQKMDVYSVGGVVHTDHPSYAGPLAPKESPQYTVNPPSGGDHLSRATPAGVWQGANVPADGNLVHALEHGYVILWFRSDVANSERGVLDSVLQELRRDTLLVERTDMPTPVAATAWGQRLLCQTADRKTLADFVVSTRNKAPEKIPH
jgi:Protein of unknown function (DUF3105)